MYQFTDDCLIGITEIDNEHRRLFQLVNEAAELLSLNPLAPASVLKVLDELTDYAATHFAHEEAYMQQINDPELPLQRREHSAFVEKLSSLRAQTVTADNAHAVLDDILKYLVRWLYRHILSSDMMIGKQTNQEDPYVFSEQFRIGVELIDKEHEQLFDIVREVHSVLDNDLLHDKYDEIMRLLGRLVAYTEQHFADEEAYMEKIHFSGLDAQKRAHAAFVERLTEIDLEDLDSIDDNQQEYLQELIQFLGGWLVNHILKMDKQIG